MDLRLFTQLFAKLHIPVVVCHNRDKFPIAYMNVRAGLLFSPSHSHSAAGAAGPGNLPDVLRFGADGEWDAFLHLAQRTGQVDKFDADLLAFDGRKLPFALSGGRVDPPGENGPEGGYFILYLMERGHADEDTGAGAYDARLSTIIHASFLAEDVEEAIHTALAMAGRFVGVDRTYIFEEISTTMTRNTYEWCSPGVEPAIGSLQNIRKEDYSYAAITEGGMYVTDDVRELPDADRAILEAQGVQAIAIFPFYDKGRPVGYIGFDDCSRPRKWSHREVDFLQNVSQILGSLIHRRKTEVEAQGSRKILELLSDNSEDVIYVNRLDDYTLVFTSRALADSLGTTRENLLGRRCWKVLQRGQQGPCPFCPIPHISIHPGEDRSEVYVWEHANTVTGKTYIAKDNIIKWVDGEYVHVETATDISARTQYEDQLRRFATVDSMTGVNNRMWGTMVLEGHLPKSGPGTSLCFIDIDGLKKTNDTYGHAAGDELLVEIVNIVRKHLQRSDFICRWGGDEFLLLLGDPPGAAAARIEEIQAEMEAYNRTSGKPYRLSFSYGVIPFDPAGGESFDALVTKADEAMYKNKMTKRGLKRRRDDD